jgi:hypothetical protein
MEVERAPNEEAEEAEKKEQVEREILLAQYEKCVAGLVEIQGATEAEYYTSEWVALTADAVSCVVVEGESPKLVVEFYADKLRIMSEEPVTLSRVAHTLYVDFATPTVFITIPDATQSDATALTVEARMHLWGQLFYMEESTGVAPTLVQEKQWERLRALRARVGQAARHRARDWTLHGCTDVRAVENFGAGETCVYNRTFEARENMAIDALGGFLPAPRTMAPYGKYILANPATPPNRFLVIGGPGKRIGCGLAFPIQTYSRWEKKVALRVGTLELPPYDGAAPQNDLEKRIDELIVRKRAEVGEGEELEQYKQFCGAQRQLMNVRFDHWIGEVLAARRAALAEVALQVPEQVGTEDEHLFYLWTFGEVKTELTRRKYPHRTRYFPPHLSEDTRLSEYERYIPAHTITTVQLQ